MKYIKVKNFEAYQHYKDRHPPWIKLYYTLWEDYEFMSLQDASKLLLIGLFTLASREENKVPADPAFIKHRLAIKGKVDLQPLIKAGFISVDSDVLAECKQGACIETETEAYTETEVEREKKAPPKGITDECKKLMIEKYQNLNIESESESCKDWHSAKGKKVKNWDAAFRNWMKKAEEFAGNNDSKGGMYDDFTG